MGTTGERALLDTLSDVLRAQPLLLVLDNFEQVLAGRDRGRDAAGRVPAS